MKKRDRNAPTLGERIIQFIGDVMMVEGYKYFSSREEWENWCCGFRADLEVMKGLWRWRKCRQPQG